MTDVTNNDHDPPATFEALLAEIEAIIARLESGELGLDESLTSYERGVRHLKACLAMLEKAERKVAQLTGVDADGSPVTQPFDEGAMTLEEKAESRSGRRSSAKPSAAGQNSLFPED